MTCFSRSANVTTDRSRGGEQQMPQTGEHAESQHHEGCRLGSPIQRATAPSDRLPVRHHSECRAPAEQQGSQRRAIERRQPACDPAEQADE